MKTNLMDNQREALLAYLEEEKLLYQQDIEASEELSDEEKMTKGLVILHALFKGVKEQLYIFGCEENNTKLRAGDSVYLVSENNKRRLAATVADNGLEEMALSFDKKPVLEGYYRIEVSQTVMLDPLIELTRRMEEGSIGASFFKMLFGDKMPSESGLRALPEERAKHPEYMNQRQQSAILQASKRPSLYAIQGPPGTGKTDVLATIATLFSLSGKEVLIVSNTHFAVNNALGKIYSKEKNLPVIKIGEELKATELDDGIERYATYYEYGKKRKEKIRRHTDYGAVVGMTIQSAIINLGLRSHGFSPLVVLVDEAGQVSLTQGAILGTFGAGSILLIGDDRQMPPVFHPKLTNHPFSVSIFSYIKQRYPQFSLRMTETYRMNQEITSLVSKAFYEDSGDALVASNYSAEHSFKLPQPLEDADADPRLTATPSVVFCQVESSPTCCDVNEAEATEAALLVTKALKGGLQAGQMAVITPFRRQVKQVRTLLKNYPEAGDVVVDTVERLQGKDVELIIISLCSSSNDYIQLMQEFILNKNRLNVMISRAKSKVILLFSEQLKEALYSTLLIK